MRLSHRFRSGLRAACFALIAFTAVAATTAARADEGSIRFRIVKAGFVIGGSAGSGVLTFHGRSYPVSIGGISYGFTFGASETWFHGRVSHITPAVGRRRRLWRGGRGRHHRARCARHRADQRQGRRAVALRPAGRTDGQRGPQRDGDFAEVGAAISAHSRVSGNPDRLCI